MDSSQRIAIVGIGGVFPGAGDLDVFWSQLKSGLSAAKVPSPDRWILDHKDALADGVTPDKVYGPKMCLIEGFELDPQGLADDPAFRKLLSQLDPVFHLLLAAGRDAWHDAKTNAIDPKRVAVMIGNIALPTDASSKLADELLAPLFEAKVLGKSTAEPIKQTHRLNRYVAGLPAGVLARALGLGGGAWTLDAACASSLYSVKYAMDELRAGRVDAVLAGGLSRPSCLYTQMGFSQLGALSPSGCCAPFDHKADGLVVGEGSGIVILKRLEDALRDDDHIYATIAGVGLSNDIEGNLMLPASEGQLRAMKQAYELADWSPLDIDLIECHGTGTPIGDGVEFTSMRMLWDWARQRGDGPIPESGCVIGSVKSNVGHLLTAAGSAGLIKTLLAMRHGVLPPTANFDSPSSRVGLDQSPFRVLAEAEPWDQRAEGRARRGAVSAFGFGGINAHLLLEQWEPASVEADVTKSDPVAGSISLNENIDDDAIAIVGMAAHYGPWENLERFGNRVFGGDPNVIAESPNHWWGAAETWSSGQPDLINRIKGFFLDRVEVPIGRFRIPPKELADMLPQQLLMLQVAYDALQDTHSLANNSDGNSGRHLGTPFGSLERAGVFIGIGLDLNTTNFHFRWTLLDRARQWAKQLGLALTDQQLDAWARQLRDAAGPPLSADRTMGALGGIVASRVARAFGVGGPSFTVSSEETSGLRALELAVRSLQSGDIDMAITGAVDLAADIRAAIGQDDGRAYSSKSSPFDKSANGSLLGEGASGLILKRRKDALRDGDRIYALVTGLGAASGGGVEEYVPNVEACRNAIERAWQDADIKAPAVGLIEAHGSAIPTEDAAEAEAIGKTYGDVQRKLACAIGSVNAAIGHAGAAAAMASLVRAAMCLYHRTLPAIEHVDQPVDGLRDGGLGERLVLPKWNQYWLRNRADGPRRAAVNALGVGGDCVHVILEQENESERDVVTGSISPIGSLRESLFVIKADDTTGLLGCFNTLRELSKKNLTISLAGLARVWWETSSARSSGQLAVALVVDNFEQLLAGIEQGLECITDGKAVAGDKVFYDPQPLGIQGEVAFVFPGAGNQYSGMGRSLGALWPDVLERLDGQNERLADQFASGKFWSGDDAQISHKDVIFSQVWLGTLNSDILQSMGVKPNAAIGYSLGETTSQFAMGSWTDRDQMLDRMEKSTLFSQDLAGPCLAVRTAWELDESEDVNWLVTVIDRSADVVRQQLAGQVGHTEKPRVYLLIVNSPDQCVIGGDRDTVLRFIQELGCSHRSVEGVTTVHCEVAQPVAEAYRQLHLMPTTAPKGVRFYSGISGKAYEISRENVADSIVGQALNAFDFTRVIESAYADGVRLFVELGPGASCSRMISSTLGDRPHVARSVCVRGTDENASMLRAVAMLVSQGSKIDLTSLFDRYPIESLDTIDKRQSTMVTVPVGGQAFDPPAPPVLIPAPRERIVGNNDLPLAPAAKMSLAETGAGQPLHAVASIHATIDQLASTQTSKAAAQETFVGLSQRLVGSIARSLEFQTELLQRAGGKLTAPVAPLSFTGVDETGESRLTDAPVVTEIKPVLDRDQCMEFAIGSIGKVLGQAFAEADTYPTRVRLPDEPLMLVDRIMEIEGETLSMTGGRVVTEHDIHQGAWYLDGGRMPTCIAVESGQADLFLSAYLGIDLQTKGNAVYRLLDAEVTFHRPLPGAGKVVRYDIQIDKFFEHADTYMFHFHFDATVDGQLLLTMRNGCAGFFTAEELDAGGGIISTRIDQQMMDGKKPADWKTLVPWSAKGEIESYSDQQVSALRQSGPNKLTQCFGSAFEGLDLADPVGLPGGRMALVHRVLSLDATGGRFGLGQIVGEADIHPDDWFLTCHFIDDRVMPGTLMYECCLHTLRIFLLRQGWVAEADQIVYEPIPGISSQLKCRGQVTETTSKVQYELTIKELGYQDTEVGVATPYVLADALMYADGKPVVQMKNMSVRLSGTTRAGIEQLWQQQGSAIGSATDVIESTVTGGEDRRPAIFDYESILAFSNGDPSKAFGDRYKVFDQDRKIARLPRPPYQFLDRIVSIEHCQPWELKSGGIIEAQYDVPADAWYFSADRQNQMPFSILLEIALQPCGWLAAYLGSALSSETDLSFRNLGGSAVLHQPVTPDMGTLTSRITMTNVATSGGMIIQNYDFAMRSQHGPIYTGDTYFGFFSKEALSNQVGIRDKQMHQPNSDEIAATTPFDLPDQAPYPSPTMRMMDQIDVFDPAGGPLGLGYIRGSTKVNPSAWFFNAHFYQDPVWPGSLGLESFIQLLKVAAWHRFGQRMKVADTIDLELSDLFLPRQAPKTSNFELMRLGQLEQKHSWVYRGQVVPKDERVTVEAVVKQIDPQRQTMLADGFLSVDGRLIYQMTDFAITISGH